MSNLFEHDDPTREFFVVGNGTPYPLRYQGRAAFPTEKMFGWWAGFEFQQTGRVFAGLRSCPACLHAGFNPVCDSLYPDSR